ncbi:MAG: hypothetical protein L0H39_09300 [Brachybacterium sp.]|nr:hypothetical protein [Brachybacterium sp.]
MLDVPEPVTSRQLRQLRPGELVLQGWPATVALPQLANVAIELLAAALPSSPTGVSLGDTRLLVASAREEILRIRGLLEVM